MTRLERLQDGLGVADDALGQIRGHLKRRRLPHAEDVELCAAQLRMAAATLIGALTFPIEEPVRDNAGKMPALPGAAPPDPEAPPGEGQLPWFREHPVMQ